MSSLKELQEFFDRYEEVDKYCRERDRKEAPDFNIFEILKVEHIEVAHSRMLFNLLSPKGSHGQGPRFLTNFLGYCKDNIGGFPELLARGLDQNDRVEVIREFGSAWGRPDLAIYSRNLRFALIIEIKIDADDQDKQIEHYRDSLRNVFEFAPPERRALIYLSTLGLPAIRPGQARASEYLCMSYRTHIAEWLDLCCREGLPTPVHELLLQYIATLRNLKDQPMEASERDEPNKE